MAQDELEFAVWRDWFASLELTPEDEDALAQATVTRMARSAVEGVGKAQETENPAGSDE